MIEYQPKPSYQMENDQKSRKNIYLYYFDVQSTQESSVFDDIYKSNMIQQTSGISHPCCKIKIKVFYYV